MMPLTVDAYLEDGCMRCKYGGTPACKVHKWPMELRMLRELMLECGFTETIKWGVPCYMAHGKNVAIVAAFKEYCSISFFQGALLSDPDGLLEKPGEQTQASRLIRFKSKQEFKRKFPYLRPYLFEAMEIEKAGLKVKTTAPNLPDAPAEWVQWCASEPELKAAFDRLTPGKKRGYLMYFAEAKQSQTRISRIEKSIPMILRGEGMGEAYSKKKKV